MCLKKRLDELRMGAKDQSNSVIAGSLRNVYRNSLKPIVTVVEHWME